MNNFQKSKLYLDIIKNKRTCIFISPHLDDAAFSIGGLLLELQKKKIKTKVVNVFTKAGNAPYTISVKRFLKECGETDASKLFVKRIAEDKSALNSVSAKVVNLNFTDALWRKRKTGQIIKLLSNLVPELIYTYPIFRLTIARGLISKNDKGLSSSLEEKLKALHLDNSIVFCPIGIGLHVDHLIVRDICKKVFTKVVYWADYPYLKTASVNKQFVKSKNLKTYIFKIDRTKKSNLVNMYKSQTKAIFHTENEIIKHDEIYYC